MSVTAIVTAILGAIGGALAIFFGLIARKDRREGDEARALLGASYERIEQLEDHIHANRLPVPTSDELRDRAQRLLDDRKRVG